MERSSTAAVELTRGELGRAEEVARRSVELADRSGDDFLRMGMRTTLADALHQQGRTGAAQELFTEAEAMQKGRQPEYPWLYSLQGFRYCDLLLGNGEARAWRVWLATARKKGRLTLGEPTEDVQVACQEARKRAEKMFE